MSLHFHSLQIADIRKETSDCVSIAFTIPEALRDIFRYKQGQYITLRSHVRGSEVRRSYSICSSPLEPELRIAIKKVTNGQFSVYANEQLQKGDYMDVLPPIGKFFTELDPAQQKNYTGFAAGSGITPLLSIIKTTLLTEPGSSFTLVYGNRNRHTVIFREELEALKNLYMERFRVIHILSREKTDTPVHSGRIDAEKCEALFEKNIDPLQTDAFFLCGPEAMIFTVKESLGKKGVDPKKIHFELFTTPGSKQAAKAHTQQPGDPAAKSRVTIRLDGTAFDFDLSYAGSSILDAALQQGADLPYACKGGVCCTCRAKLVEGEVKMEVNYGLEPDEIEKGFILTCQSHPRTGKVVVDFDTK